MFGKETEAKRIGRLRSQTMPVKTKLTPSEAIREEGLLGFGNNPRIWLSVDIRSLNPDNPAEVTSLPRIQPLAA